MTQVQKTLSRSEQKKQDVLIAAVAEFSEQGFAGASMDNIALRAQVSKRTVYNHFASKELLFEQATVQLWHGSKSAASVPYDSQRPLAEQLCQIARQSFAFYQQPGFIKLSRVVMAEYIRQPGRADAVMAKLKLQEGGLESWLAAAVADGRLQDMDLQIATHQFWGLFKAFFFWPKVLQSQGYDEMAEQIIQNNVLMFLAFYQRSADSIAP